MKTFNPSSKHPERAYQAWIILVSAAMNRQTFTYEGLSRFMYGKKASGVLDKILGHIAFYCNEEGLAPLTALVVGKSRGTPGQDIPVDLSTIDKQREQVYETDWFDIVPPSIENLKSSFDRGVKAGK